MSDFDEAVNAVRAHSAAYQPVLRSWAAYLGDGEGTVIGSQANYYNCRYPTPESPAVEVYANGCPPNDGLRVMVGYSADQPDLIKIVSWNDSSRDDSSNDQVKRHGDQHFYLGGDTVWVDWRQITTFRVEPYSGLTVYVRGGVLPRAGADLQVIPQIIDLTSSVPGSAGYARYALLSIDSTGAIIVTDGTTVTPIMSLDASDVPSTPSGNFRIAAVALSYGQTNVTESLLQRDILDLRWPQESMAGIGVITPAMLANASAQYKYLVSGATPFAYAESAGALNIASGKTLTVSNSLTLAGTDGLSLTISGNSTINGSFTGITTKSVNRVVCVGDSLSVSTEYPTRLALLFDSAVWQVVGNGISGISAVQLSSYILRSSTASDHYAVVLVGINDIVSGVAAATIEAALQTIYTALKTAGRTVVAVEILPWKANAGWSAGKQTVTDDVNTWINATAINVDYIIPAYAAMENTPGDDLLKAAYDSGDGLHPNVTGQNALSSVIFTNTTWTPVALSPIVTLNGISTTINQGLASSDSPTFKSLTIAETLTMGRLGLVTSMIRPPADAVRAIEIYNAAFTGTPVMTFDTTNSRVGINNIAPTVALDVAGNFKLGQSSGPSTMTISAGNGYSPNFILSQVARDSWFFAMPASSTSLTIYSGSNSNVITALNTGNVGIGVSPSTRLHVLNTTTTTNAVLEVARLEARVSTAATGSSAGFGPMLTAFAETATDGTNRQVAAFKFPWATSTDATRKGQIVGTLYDTAERQWLQVDTDGVASTTTITASQAGAYATTAINLTLTTAHHWVKATAACTITLPTAIGITGREYIITATANSVVIDGNASETISGSLTVTLNTGDTLQIKSDNANWFIC